MMRFKSIIVGTFVTAMLFAVITDVCGKRGRGRSRSKSRVQIGLPITGKYRDPESDQYYNHNDVFIYFIIIISLQIMLNFVIYFISGS